MALTQVTSAGVKDGELVNADLHSAAAIALSKLGTSGTAGSGNFLRGDGAWTAIDLTALNASNLTSGTVAAARLDTATTQSAGNNSTKIATTAYADTAISNLVDSSPSALNTLNELAAALGDDANFSTTVTNSIATKAVLSGSTNNTICTVTGANAIQGEANLIFDGTNLGIGTTSPVTSLHCAKSGSGGVFASFTNDTSGHGSGNGTEIGIGGDEQSQIWNYENTYFRLATSNTERLRVDSSGRLLLGLTSSIGGDAIFQVQGSGNRKVHFHQPDTGACIAQFTNTTTGTGTGDGFIIGITGAEDGQIWHQESASIKFGTSDIERLHITSAGSVGINESSPLAKLHVKIADSGASAYAHTALVVEDSDHTFIDIMSGTSGSGGINFGDSGNSQRGVVEYDHSNDYMRFITAQGERLRITDTGNVGISTTSPQRMLQVGAHGSGNGEIAIGSATSGYGSILFGDGTSGNELYRGYVQYNHSGEYMLLATSGIERVRLGPSGEIGTGGASYGTSGQVLTSGGSGAAVSWTTISAGTTLSGSTDNEITTVTGANAIQGESNLLFSGNRFTVRSNEMVLGQTLPDGGIVVQAKTNMTNGYALPLVSASPNATQAGRARAGIAAISEDGVSGMHMVFMTRYAGDGTDLDVTADERLRITSGGRVGINQNPLVSKLEIAHNGTSTPVNQIELNTPDVSDGGGSGIFFKNSGATGSSHTNRYGSRIHTVRGSNGASTFVVSNEKTGGTTGLIEAFKIDSDQRVFKPQQPRFAIASGNNLQNNNSAYWGDGSGGSAGTGDYLTIQSSHNGGNAVPVNVGSHYDGSSGNNRGKFTVPVAGTYFFYLSASMADSNSHFVRLSVNGSNMGNTIMLQYDSTYQAATMCQLFTLSANDYVQVKRRGDGNSMYSVCWGGWLVA